jgi:hypothetical protein
MDGIYIDDNVVVVVAADVPSRSCAGGCCSPSCSFFSWLMMMGRASRCSPLITRCYFPSFLYRVPPRAAQVCVFSLDGKKEVDESLHLFGVLSSYSFILLPYNSKSNNKIQSNNIS